MLFLMYVSIPPPGPWALSVRIAVKLGSEGVLCLGCKSVSCVIMMSMLCVLAIWSSSVVFLCSPQMFIWSILRVLFVEGSGFVGWVRVCGGGVVWVGVGFVVFELCRVQVQVFVYCFKGMPAHLRCIQCFVCVLQSMDVCLCVMLCEQSSQIHV